MTHPLPILALLLVASTAWGRSYASAGSAEASTMAMQSVFPFGANHATFVTTRTSPESKQISSPNRGTAYAGKRPIDSLLSESSARNTYAQLAVLVELSIPRL